MELKKKKLPVLWHLIIISITSLILFFAFSGKAIAYWTVVTPPEKKDYSKQFESGKFLIANIFSYPGQKVTYNVGDFVYMDDSNTNKEELFYVKKDAEPTNTFHDPNEFPTGNYARSNWQETWNLESDWEKDMVYQKVGPGFYPRNVYFKGDCIYNEEDDAIYECQKNFYPNFNGAHVSLNAITQGLTKPQYWEKKTTYSKAVYKPYNLYYKYDITENGGEYYYCPQKYLFNDKKPGTILNKWKIINEVKTSKSYNKFDIVKKSVSGEILFYQAKKDNVSGSNTEVVTDWKRVYPRI